MLPITGQASTRIMSPMTAAVASLDMEQPVLRRPPCHPDNRSYTNDVAREPEACQAAGPAKTCPCRIIAQLPSAAVRKAGSGLHCEMQLPCTFVYKRYCSRARTRSRTRDDAACDPTDRQRQKPRRAC